MLNKLKDILNTYTYDELNEMELLINSSLRLSKIITDDHIIDLITNHLIIDLKEE